MLDGVVNALLYLLNPTSRVEYVWKLLVLCMLTTAVAMSTEGLIGTEITNPVETYFLIVFVVSAPFFSLAMVVVRRMHALQNELARMASTDLLTGLANRRSFFETHREVTGGQILLLDVDHFKRINDTYGHGVGDEVLQAVARHLSENVRESDKVSRFGGEEFAVFLPDADAETAKAIGDRLVTGLTIERGAAPDVSVTLSAGLAELKPPATVSDAIRRADAALYKAKRDGRARLAEWSERLSSARAPA